MADIETSYIIAESIRRQLSNTTFQYGDVRVNITSSFGVFSFTDYNIELSELLPKVDRNLYIAKNRGKNTTIINDQS